MRVRLTYTNTSNDFDLTPRDINDPVTIGRSQDAALQVPSINISRHHAVMFVHDGQWMVQDASSREGTMVNGEKLTEAVSLAVGDQVKLGTGTQAATLEVLSLDTQVIAGQAVAEPPFDALEGVALPPPVSVQRTYRKKGNPNAPIIFAVSAAVLIGAGVIGGIVAYVSYTKKLANNEEIERQNRNTKRQEVVVKKVGESTKQSIFTGSVPATPDAKPPVPSPTPTPSENTGNAKTTGSTGSGPSVAAPPVGQTPATPSRPQDDVILDPQKPADPVEAEWASILEHRDSSSLPVALYQFSVYRAEHPNSPKLKELDKMQATALDQLWWERINLLVEQNLQISEQIASLKKEKSELPSDATKERKAQFDMQVKDLESTQASNRLLLEGEMGYKSLKRIDTSDEKQMEAMRKERKTEDYDPWSQRVMSRIRQSRGASAW